MQQLGYLDAGTGSMLVSAIVAGAAGVGVIFRLGWRRVVGCLSPKRRAQQDAEAQEAAEQRAGEPDPAVSVSADESAGPRA